MGNDRRVKPGFDQSFLDFARKRVAYLNEAAAADPCASLSATAPFDRIIGIEEHEDAIAAGAADDPADPGKVG